jgi:hypothetical protein
MSSVEIHMAYLEEPVSVEIFADLVRGEDVYLRHAGSSRGREEGHASSDRVRRAGAVGHGHAAKILVAPNPSPHWRSS